MLYGGVKKYSISLRLYLKSSHNGDKTGSFSKLLLKRRDKMAVHGTMGEFCLHHYCRANDVDDNETLAVLCNVWGLLMHKLIKNLLIPRSLSDYLSIQL